MAAGDGLISMTPTSIAHAGTSATINADGGVDFSAVTSLSLNGVFTGDYDNYLIVITATTGTDKGTTVRLRASGTDASGSNYTAQRLRAYSTTANGQRDTSQTSAVFGPVYAAAPSGFVCHVYGPALAQPTAWRSVSEVADVGAAIFDVAATHSLSTAYDGWTWNVDSGSSVTGTIHVFGYEE